VGDDEGGGKEVALKFSGGVTGIKRGRKRPNANRRQARHGREEDQKKREADFRSRTGASYTIHP